jgi:uroporphyrinogen decarboxylase-like protein
MSEMSFRERFINTIQYKPVDRLPERHAYGLMPGVLEEWHSQGLPADIEEEDIREYFGFPAHPGHLPLEMGPLPAFEERVLEETQEYRVAMDAWGRKTKIMKGVTTLALGKEFPVKDWETWLPYKERLQFHTDRIGPDLDAAMAGNIESGNINAFYAMGFYWFPRDLMGDEELAISYYTQPDLIHDMNETWCSLIEELLGTTLATRSLDMFHLNEDMAYKNASMIGKPIFDEFMAPYYLRMNQIVKDRHIPVFSVDSDGCLNELIFWFKSCGVNLIGPNEVQAGNDITAYRQEFGNGIAFDGGIDKRELVKGSAAIDRMLEKIIPPIMSSGGGWVISLDHRIIPGTGLDDFCYYLNRMRELTAF